MEIKIAHCADLHINSLCRASGCNTLPRAYEIKNVIFEILKVCTEEKVQVLLIAGDMFDGVNISDEDLLKIKTAFKSSKFTIAISPGNHDPFTADSPYNCGDWPQNTVIFKSDGTTHFDVPCGARVWGSAFTGTYKSGFNMNFDGVNKSAVNLCVLHGLAGGTEKDPYCPFKISDFESSGMNYIALGHIHRRSEILKAGNTYYAYCGCPEGRGFDETGEKGIYIGTVSENSCNLKFRRICRRRYEHVSIDVSGCISEEDIFRTVISRLERDYKENYAENLYKISLTGSLHESFCINEKQTEFALNEVLFYAKIKDNTKVEIDINNFLMRNDFKGIFIKKMMSRIEKPCTAEELEINKNSLKIGLKAFNGDVSYSGD